MSTVPTQKHTVIDTLIFEHPKHPTRTFIFQRGLSSEQVAQLTAYSQDATDTALQDNSSDLKRFGEGSYSEWLAKDRTAYGLLDKETGQLAAFAWFGPKVLGAKSTKHVTEEEQVKIDAMDAENYHTGAYRSYAQYRGTGIMSQFLVAVIRDYTKLHPNAVLWLIVQSGNDSSLALAKKLVLKKLKIFADDEHVLIFHNHEARLPYHCATSR